MGRPDIPRHLEIRQVLASKSCFLFGPRQTGKPTLIHQQLAGRPVYDLLDQSMFLRLSRNPTLIREALTPDAPKRDTPSETKAYKHFQRVCPFSHKHVPFRTKRFPDGSRSIDRLI